MKEKNKKSSSIFYAVTGIITLVIAIIGSTVAFFAANNTAAIAQGTTAAAGGVGLTVTPITATNTNLIPLNLRTGDTAGVDTFDQFAPAMAAGCVDENGNNVCQVYRIVVTNNSTTSTITIRGQLTLTSTAKNMYWRLISATDDGAATPKMTGGSKVDYSTDVLATSTGGRGNLTVGGNSRNQAGSLGNGAGVASHTLGTEASATYYVVIWLEEMGQAQQTDDASKEFSGTVFFSAVDANGDNTGITASFKQKQKRKNIIKFK